MNRDPPNGEGLPHRAHLLAPSGRDQGRVVVREVDLVRAPGHVQDLGLAQVLGLDQALGLDRDLVRLGPGLVLQGQKVRGQDLVLDLGPVQAHQNQEGQGPHPVPGPGPSLAHAQDRDQSLDHLQEDQDQDHRRLRPGHARLRLQQVLAQPQINLLFEIKKNKDICITKQLVVVVKIKNCEWF